jgi:hypothetical protein
MGFVEDPPLAPHHAGRDEIPRTRRTDSGKGLPPESRIRIDSKDPVRPDIIEMVGNMKKLVVNDHNSVKIIKDKKSGKPETGIPERVWNPGIEVIEIRRRVIIGHNRRSGVVIIIIDHDGIRITIMGKPPALPGDSPEFDISGNIKETSYP